MPFQLNQPLINNDYLVEKGVGSIFVKSVRPMEATESSRRKRSSSGLVADTQIALLRVVNASDVDSAYVKINSSETNDNSSLAYTSQDSQSELWHFRLFLTKKILKGDVWA